MMDRRDDIVYQLGYAEELLRQIISHHDRGDSKALAHSIDVARRFLEEQDR